jgi:hypothetical protein
MSPIILHVWNFGSEQATSQPPQTLVVVLGKGLARTHAAGRTTDETRRCLVNR